MYRQREIVLVPFPYSNLSSLKRRPVLVVPNDRYNENYPDILVCVITSNLLKDEYSAMLTDQDIEMGSLPEKSDVKCHKLFTTEQSKILKRFSMVSEKKFLEVQRYLEKLIEKTT